MKRREFVMVGGGHRKFWTVETKGSIMTCAWGRMGTAGQQKSWTYGSAGAAEDAALTKIYEKTGKGYVEQRTGVSMPAGPPDVTDEEMAAARSRLEGVMEELSE